MNILFDLITCQSKYGAGEYVRRVLCALMEELRRRKRADVRVFALYDSRRGIAYEDLRPDRPQWKNVVEFADCAETPISEIVRQNKIDLFFVGCVQFVGEYPTVDALDCEVIAVVHDVRDEEFLENKIFEYLCLNSLVCDYKDKFRSRLLNKIRYARRSYYLGKGILALRHDKPHEQRLGLMKVFERLLRRNPKASLIAVSEYTRYSMITHWPWMKDRISVGYSPSRIVADLGESSNAQLAQLIESRKKYILLMSADRDYKNARKALSAFGCFVAQHPDYHLLSVGDPDIKRQNVIALPFLNDRDLDLAIRNCHALLYPTLFEGFGYPPLEAMKYGKPVLSSNVTSMPEVLGDAPIYFSPFYDADIFAAMMKLADADYAALSDRSRKRYAEVSKRQEADLTSLVRRILHDPV